LEDNIKRDLKERCEGVKWIDLVQDKDKWRTVVYKVIKFRAPKILEFLA